MKAVILLLLLICVAGCAASDKDAIERDLEVTAEVLDEAWESTKEIEVRTAMTNNSRKSVHISHAAPLIQVQIYDEDNVPLLDGLVTLMVGINHELKPAETYDPYIPSFAGGKRMIAIEKPGTYKLIATATYWMDNGSGGDDEFQVSSTPLMFEVG